MIRGNPPCESLEVSAYDLNRIWQLEWRDQSSEQDGKDNDLANNNLWWHGWATLLAYFRSTINQENQEKLPKRNGWRMKQKDDGECRTKMLLNQVGSGLSSEVGALFLLRSDETFLEVAVKVIESDSK